MSLTLLSCSKDPSAIGVAYLKGDLINLDSLNSYPVKPDTLTQVSYSYHYSPALGYSTSLLLGQKGNNVATTLMSFNIVLPDTITAELNAGTIQVSDAIVRLYKSYTFGDTTLPFDFSAYPITSGWTSTGFTIDSLSSLQYDKTTNVFNGPKGHDTLLYTYHMQPSLALTWISNIAAGKLPDNGIVLVPTTSTNRIIGFYALSSSTTVDIPFIDVVLNKVVSGQTVYTDTLSFSTTADLSVVSGTIPQNTQDDYIYAQSSVALESRLVFDVSKLPKNAIINYAELQLTVDTTKSAFGSSFTDQLTAKYITDTTHIDSLSTSAVNLTRSVSTPVYIGNITYFVQTWLSTKINMGIQIQPYNYTEGVELWTIYGSKAIDPAKRPRLKITYTKKL